MRRVEVKRRGAYTRRFRSCYDAGIVGRTLSIFLLGLAACAPPPPRTVPRVVDGRVEQGDFVSPFAYEWFIEGEMSAAKGRHDEAAIALETAKAAPSNDALLMARLAEEYERSGSSRRADRALSAARRADPNSARVYIAEGRILGDRGKHDEAIVAFNEARALDPNSDEAVIALADALRNRGLPLRADAVLIDYARRHGDPSHRGVHHVLIDLAHANGDAEGLARALSLAVGPDPERAAFQAAALAYETGQPALAARLLDGSLRTDEGRGLWLRAAIESGQREVARDALEETSSDTVGGAARHAELLLAVDARERALEVLQSERPTPEVQYLRGKALFDRGDYVSAARALAAVPSGSSTFEKARLTLADTVEAQARSGAAMETLSFAHAESREVRDRMAALHASHGSLRRGLQLFDPKKPSERASIARLFEAAGRYQEAAAYYATVEEDADEPPWVHARAAAERLMSRGLTRSAATMLEHWTRAAPHDVQARVRLVEIRMQLGDMEAAAKEGGETLPFVDDARLRVHLQGLLAEIDP